MRSEPVQVKPTATTEATTPDVIIQRLLVDVERLMRRLEVGGDALVALQRVSELLDALPLAAGEFGTASNRLRNARRYLQSEERGAARYELQMLAGSLRHHLESNPGPQRRRPRRLLG